jgi:hypothetical protein
LKLATDIFVFLNWLVYVMKLDSQLFWGWTFGRISTTATAPCGPGFRGDVPYFLATGKDSITLHGILFITLTNSSLYYGILAKLGS